MAIRTARPASFTDTHSQRLDIWLFRTRLIKSRSLATKMVLSGKIRISRNGQTERVTKPGTKIRDGYGIMFMHGSELINVVVEGLPERRGPANEARENYRIAPVEVTRAHEGS